MFDSSSIVAFSDFHANTLEARFRRFSFSETAEGVSASVVLSCADTRLFKALSCCWNLTEGAPIVEECVDGSLLSALSLARLAFQTNAMSFSSISVHVPMIPSRWSDQQMRIRSFRYSHQASVSGAQSLVMQPYDEGGVLLLVGGGKVTDGFEYLDPDFFVDKDTCSDFASSFD